MLVYTKYSLKKKRTVASIEDWDYDFLFDEDIIRLFFDQHYAALPLYNTNRIKIWSSILLSSYIHTLSRIFYELAICLCLERIREKIAWNKSFQISLWKYIRRDNPFHIFNFQINDPNPSIMCVIFIVWPEISRSLKLC